MRVVTGYTNGKPDWSLNEPGRARITNRGGLALGQALTAVGASPGVAEVKPVGAAAESVPLRGEALLRQRRKR